MKTSLVVVALLAVLCLASPAHAWNCSDPLASRVPVPAGTTGSFGNGDGQLFMGTGTEGVKGQLYECKVPTPNPKPTGAPISQTQNQTQTQTQTTSSTANSDSASKSNASSNSTSNAMGGNSTSTAVGGSATAQGGSSAIKNSGNSTLTNSGNSSNTNSNTAEGGQGGSATASATGNGVGNGNGSNNTSSVTNVAAPRIPVETAVGIAPPPTVPCAIGFGLGAQTMAFGISGSGAKVDKNCAILETARSFASMNARLAYCKTMLINKYAKKAGITLEDCMFVPTPVLIPQPTVVVPQPQPLVIIQAPPPEVVAPVQVTSVGTLTDLGSFKVTRSYSTNLCPTVQVVLGTNGVQILNKAIALGGEVTLIGNVYTTAVATSYLRKHGVSRVVVKAADEQDNSVAVQVWSVK